MTNTTIEVAIHQHSVQMLKQQLEIKFALSVDMVKGIGDKLQRLALPELEALFVELIKLRTVQQLNGWLEKHSQEKALASKMVLVPEDEWQSIQETLYLLSIPGMRESIRVGLDTPVSECSEELVW
jgi:hypothetical protein